MMSLMMSLMMSADSHLKIALRGDFADNEINMK